MSAIAAPRTRPDPRKHVHLWRSIAVLAAVLDAWLGAHPAGAAACGGKFPCQCGDTVAADYQLAQALGPCPGHGLLVRSNVTLDCRGARITGLANGSEQFGIFLDGRRGAQVTGATVKNCHVSGFLRGIRLREANSNVISGNDAGDNGDQVKHVGYGIDVSGGSTNNLLEGNRVHGNADEGIHIGSGSHRNRLVGNVVTDNHRENLYILAADGGVFVRNTLGSGGVNSLYLKDSSSNRFEDNTFSGKAARVIGSARANQFLNNTFAGAPLHFTAYRGQAGRAPTGNRVTGGSISAPAECVRFTGSGGNVIADVSLLQCRTAVRAESPAEPTSNTLVGLLPPHVQLDERSTLDQGWPLVVHVREPAGAPVAGARVEGRDASGGPGFTATTDDAGSTPSQIVVAASRTGAHTAARPPLTLSVSKPGYRPATHPLPTTESTPVTIELEPEQR